MISPDTGARAPAAPTPIPSGSHRRPGPLPGGGARAGRLNAVPAAVPNLVLALVLAVAAAAWPPAPAAGDDPDMARLLRAAERGDVEAMFELGTAYFSPDHYSKSLEFFGKAAELGHAPSQQALSIMYYSGFGTPVDYAKSFQWMKRAAESGFADAQLGLGLMYQDGVGTPADISKAVEWWRRAAAQGNGPAKARLRAHGY